MLPRSPLSPAANSRLPQNEITRLSLFRVARRHRVEKASAPAKKLAGG